MNAVSRQLLKQVGVRTQPSSALLRHGKARLGLGARVQDRTGGPVIAKLCTPIGGQMAGLPAGQVGGRQACESL